MANIDTSMEYLPKEEVMAIWNANLKLTDEDFLAMDDDEFRARVRERCHHTLESLPALHKFGLEERTSSCTDVWRKCRNYWYGNASS